MTKTIKSVLLMGFTWLLLVLADRLLIVYNAAGLNVFGWLAFVYSSVPWVLVALVPLGLLGRHSRWLYAPLVLFVFFFVVVAWFVRVKFSIMLDGDWVGMLLGSSRAELAWFFGQCMGWKAFLIAVSGLVVSFCLIRIVWCAGDVCVTRMTVVCSAFSFCVFLYAMNPIANRLKEFEREPVVNFISDSLRNCRTYRELANMKRCPKLPSGLRASARVGDEVGVFVLGESATRTRWGLYGYRRDTTPNLSRRAKELVRFDDLVAAWGNTANSLRFLFTTRTLEKPFDLRYTLPQALRQSGCAASLVSNHERWGKWDGDESFDLAGCEPMTFMREVGETNSHDEVILPYVEREVMKQSSRHVVFVHLMGSHEPSCDRYPFAMAPFEPERFRHSSDLGNPDFGQNHYDNSIWYTDWILERILRLLEKTGKPSWLIYLSDHGESPSSNGWRVMTDRDLWDIPFIIWLSPEFRAKHPERVKLLEEAAKRPLQSDQLFYGLLEFAGVEGLGESTSENFLSESFQPRQPRLIQQGRVPYP